MFYVHISEPQLTLMFVWVTLMWDINGLSNVHIHVYLYLGSFARSTLILKLSFK